jgi:hypothetical protein
MVQYLIEAGDRVEFNQDHCYCSIRLCRQAVKRAREGRRRTRTDANDIFHDRERLLCRSLDGHHASAFTHLIDKFRERLKHALESQTPPEQLVRPLY